MEAQQPNTVSSPRLSMRLYNWANLLVCTNESIINFLCYKAYQEKLRRQYISEGRAWLEIFLIAFVIFLLGWQYLAQRFIIFSGSMIPTLLVQEQVIVNKSAYGLEPYPFTAKLCSKRKVERVMVIPFVAPEYRRPSTLFLIVQRIVLLVSFTYIDLDQKAYQATPTRPVRLASQPMLYTPQSTPYIRYNYQQYQPALLVKRVISLAGDRVRFRQGNIEIRLSGSKRFSTEEQIKNELGHTVPKPARDLRAFTEPRNYFFTLDASYEKRVYNSSFLSNPHNTPLRSRFLADTLGDAIPVGYFEAFGDNRCPLSRWQMLRYTK